MHLFHTPVSLSLSNVPAPVICIHFACEMAERPHHTQRLQLYMDWTSVSISLSCQACSLILLYVVLCPLHIIFRQETYWDFYRNWGCKSKRRISGDLEVLWNNGQHQSSKITEANLVRLKVNKCIFLKCYLVLQKCSDMPWLTAETAVVTDAQPSAPNDIIGTVLHGSTLLDKRRWKCYCPFLFIM